MTHDTLRWFSPDHLPADQATWVRKFRALAEDIDGLHDGPEKSAAIRKLLEAKDCTVRASLSVSTAEGRSLLAEGRAQLMNDYEAMISAKREAEARLADERAARDEIQRMYDDLRGQLAKWWDRLGVEGQMTGYTHSAIISAIVCRTEQLEQARTKSELMAYGGTP